MPFLWSYSKSDGPFLHIHVIYRRVEFLIVDFGLINVKISGLVLNPFVL